MEMHMDIQERLAIATLFPERGNIVTQTMVRDISEKTRLNQEEIDKVDFKVIGDAYQWKKKDKEGNELSVDIDITFTDAELRFLKEQVNRLDKENKIDQSNLNLCVKIRDLDMQKRIEEIEEELEKDE
jgi:hypothetical protein